MKLKDFYHLSVPGDGDCFFHAVTAILHFDKNPVLKHTKDPNKVKNIKFNLGKESMALRRRVVDWLKNNLDYVVKGIGLTIRMEIEETVQNEVAIAEEKDIDPDYTTVDEYLEYMNKGGTYAGQIEIYAVCELLQRNLRVFTSKNSKDHNETLKNIGLGYELKDISYSSLPSSKDIYLYHNFGKKGVTKGRHHFEPLIPRKIIKIEISEEKKSTGGIRKVHKQTRKVQKPVKQTRKVQKPVKQTRKVQKPVKQTRKVQKPVPRRTQRPVPRRTQRPVPRRTQRPVPRRTQRPVPRRTQRSTPRRTQRSVPRRTQRSVPRRTQRSVPRRTQRSVPRRTQRSVPRRTQRKEERKRIITRKKK